MDITKWRVAVRYTNSCCEIINASYKWLCTALYATLSS